MYKVINVKNNGAVSTGRLSFFESGIDIPFEIKRIYYITNVSHGIRRGYHAHKNLKQLIFCPFGEIKLFLDDGINSAEIILNDPSTGILIEKPVWREMLWIKDDSVLCVAASDYYNESDYIRNYDEFKKYISEEFQK